jgi:hypothetical protein
MHLEPKTGIFVGKGSVFYHFSTLGIIRMNCLNVLS